MTAVLEPGEGKTLDVLGLQFTPKATGNETAGAYTLIEAVLAVDPPPHIHGNEEEAIYVLEGQVDLLVGNRKVKGTPGTFVLVPRGTVHNVISAGGKPARVLLIFSPPAIQGLFDEVDGQADMDKIMAALGRYNMELSG